MKPYLMKQECIKHILADYKSFLADKHLSEQRIDSFLGGLEQILRTKPAVNDSDKKKLDYKSDIDYGLMRQIEKDMGLTSCAGRAETIFLYELEITTHEDLAEKFNFWTESNRFAERDDYQLFLISTRGLGEKTAKLIMKYLEIVNFDTSKEYAKEVVYARSKQKK